MKTLVIAAALSAALAQPAQAALSQAHLSAVNLASWIEIAVNSCSEWYEANGELAVKVLISENVDPTSSEVAKQRLKVRNAVYAAPTNRVREFCDSIYHSALGPKGELGKKVPRVWLMRPLSKSD